MLLFPALLRAQGEPAPSDVPETPQNAGAGEWRGKGAIAIREVPVYPITVAAMVLSLIHI